MNKYKSSLSFECPVYQLKSKKDSLMTTFKGILRRIKACHIADTDVRSYNSNWFAFKTMATFLLKSSNQTEHETQIFFFINS